MSFLFNHGLANLLSNQSLVVWIVLLATFSFVCMWEIWEPGERKVGWHKVDIFESLLHNFSKIC